MNLNQRNNKQKQLNTQLKQLVAQINQLPTAGCHTCKHFAFECGLCGEAPPAEVISVGCDQWEYDEVPTILGDLTTDNALLIGREG